MSRLHIIKMITMNVLVRILTGLSGMFLACSMTVQAQNPDSELFKKYFSPATETPAVPSEDGYICRWTILEPIATQIPSNRVLNDDFIKDTFNKFYFKDQMTVIPRDGQSVKIEKTKHVWHALDAKNFYVNLLRFAEGYGKEYYGQVYWVVTTINCDKDIENVRISSGANSAAMWYLNGEEVLMLSNDRDLICDDCMSKRITLKKGENVIRGMVFNGPGMADFCMRFVDENGNPVTDFTVSSVIKRK